MADDASTASSGERDERPVRTLLFSTLFPSRARPGHGLFVETRMRELLAGGGIQTQVVAPVPWFPFGHERFGAYAAFARTPRVELRHGVTVAHPRYLLPPKVGMHVAPALMALGALRTLQSIRAAGFDFDVIDAHYFYPDGVAAALLASWLNRPFVVTARGSDLNLIGRYRIPAAQMRWAAHRAAANIGVSAALADIIAGWGVGGGRVHVLRNGVDGELFRPIETAVARRGLGIEGGPVLLTVGQLVALKRQAIAIEALAEMRATHPHATLLIVGDGPERASLESLASRLGLSGCVRFLGAVPQASLPEYYSAADAMLLPSQREGWPNVVLESLACGTPVVAARVGGVPEILGDGAFGAMVDADARTGYAESARRFVADPRARASAREHALRMGWRETSAAQLALFRGIVGTAGRHTGRAAPQRVPGFH